ncbi:MAG: sulfotransferase domain-containing protein [Reichenbachiella sp.]|uniref:sulfotransferase domain-containing protein n=1 Tax=Reichenbachiella sp. TaxID=2184521 RepID=UPI003263CAB0
MNLAIFVGPAKTGTTWLFEYAKYHPNLVASSKDKEIQYFNKYYTKGKEWYLSYFDQNSDFTKCDFSPSYFASEISRLRIKTDFPTAKIIITLRNPIERTISHYKHFLKLGLIRETDAKLALGKNTTFISNSFYSKYLPEWIEEFGQENILILPIEGMKENINDYINQLCSFLELDFIDAKKLANTKINEQSIPRNRTIAYLASRSRRFTKNYGMRWLTEGAKRIGLKKAIYSGGRNDVLIPEDVYAELKQLFAPEIKRLRKYLDPRIYEKYYKNE